MKTVRLLSVQIALAVVFVRLLPVQECRADTETDIRIAMAMATAVPPPAFTAGPVAAALPPIDFDLSALAPAPAVAVPAAARFQRGSFNPGHACPECGNLVLAKAGSAGNGQHWHVCPRDGCYWWHLDQ